MSHSLVRRERKRLQEKRQDRWRNGREMERQRMMESKNRGRRNEGDESELEKGWGS